jgi:PAS domain S-box-containing protein
MDGIIRSWNRGAEKIYGYTSLEVVGKRVSLLIPPGHPDELPNLMDRLKRGERVEHFETVRVRKDGQRLEVSLSISPIKDDGGVIIGASAIARDITERRRLYQQLQEADRRKDEFLATLAHELRNPLAPIRNALQILRLAGDNKAAVEQVRTIMERQLQQMVRLIDDLMDVSRITRSKLQLRKERVDVVTVLRNAVETSRPLIETAGHNFTLALPSEPIHLEGDEARLAQVFSNLLNNAAKYTERGGRIWLTVESASEEVHRRREVIIRVKDTGVGIPADQLKQIFEMFSQVDHSLERAQGGLGIGLTLVKWLTEMHGGTVEAHSEGQGKGSEFIVRLPIVNVPPAQRETCSAEGESKAPARPCRVLIVEDSDDAATSMRTILRMMGHDVRIAQDGIQAVDEAGAYLPDVVLLDIGLPKMSGFEVALRIRRQPWGKNMKLVALTGWGQEEDKRRSKDVGFDLHVIKPLEPASLEELLRKLCPPLA